ncbi:ATP-binding protein [Aquimarina sp. D1M17]|uniref:AAA family ATPase n=1 Tax=Aquimarina acroporae TaxID=2937283 RepID=UPI0020BF8606|nr:AAA family ATPase [Aquimarina acroporae]MCK8521479.1 ATP-binding protein [Aquimarina acroporae]
MIIGLLLRYIKTYQGINYIPITSKDKFCGFVGNNGIGKSSVLEALDCFFNDKQWNYNITTKRSGFSVTTPLITPLFLIKKDKISESNKPILESLSNTVWDLQESDIPSINRPHFKTFQSQRTEIERTYKKEEYYLFPLGIDHKGNCALSIFNCNKVAITLFPEIGVGNQNLTPENIESLKPILKEIKSLYQYIYIPKDIDPATFTKLETTEIQALMGESLFEVLEERVPQSQIAQINRSLNQFLTTLSEELDIYSFRTPTDRQQNLRKNDIYKLIIDAFFTIRKLHKKQGKHWLEITDLSSGEKQKAIIEVTHSLIKNHRENTDNLIIAVDEPESSLHMSACFDHFMKMSEISDESHQFLFSTHWYGFLPIIERGSVTAISKIEQNHRFDLISLANYREMVKQQIRDSRGQLPYDIRLKSMNDFVQSIVTSILDENPFNWIICEGSSEKIYFDYYFKNLRSENKLRIIPVGGANEIKRIYEYLVVAIDEFKREVNGKIAFILDTDSELVQFETQNTSNIFIKRLVNVDNETKLININSNPKSPPTEIEDSLNGKAFYKVLKKYKSQYPGLLSFVNVDIEKSEIPSYFALDLRPSEYENLLNFFDSDNIKYDFAKEFITEISSEIEYIEMNWINEIRTFFEE